METQAIIGITAHCGTWPWWVTALSFTPIGVCMLAALIGRISTIRRRRRARRYIHHHH